MKTALIVNTEKLAAISCSKRISEHLREWGAETLMLSSQSSVCGISKVQNYSTYEELFDACDVAVTVGGDGTIIHSARYAAIFSKPIVGVNMGRLGYVAELEESELSMLHRLITGDYTIQDRMVLSVEILRENRENSSYLAVNDVNISRGYFSGMVELQVSADDENIASYRADGLLFSTPTGSTAYALSAGGPVIDPKLSLIELTPLCPHSLTARPVLFNSDTTLTVSSKSGDKVFLAIDGQVFVELENTDRIRVSASEYKLSTIVLKDRNFYKLAGEKLREGDFK